MRVCYTRTRAEGYLGISTKAGARPTQGNRSLHIASPQVGEDQTPNNGTGSFRNRKGSFRALPLPPVLDPVKIAAKERYKQPKARFPTHGWTPFQEKLRQNPYAEALASPGRACVVTGVRLPSFFHIDYNITQHPETERLWMLPNLSSAKPKSPHTEAHEYNVYPETRRNVVKRSEHFLARRPLLRFISSKSRWDKVWSSPTKEKLKGKVGHLIWRRDMDDFVLGMLREAAMTRLKWLFDHPGAALVAKLPNVVESDGASDDISCVLVNATFESDMVKRAQMTLREAQSETEWIGRRFNRLVGVNTSSSHGQHLVPLMAAVQAPEPIFLTTAYHDHNVPVYSLPDVLGPENSKKLLEASSLSDGLNIGIRRSKQSLGAQMALMKLHFYLEENTV